MQNFSKVLATSWNEETSKVHGWDIIKALKVCNDRAVHEAKLASDFLPMSVFEKKKKPKSLAYSQEKKL